MIGASRVWAALAVTAVALFPGCGNDAALSKAPAPPAESASSAPSASPSVEAVHPFAPSTPECPTIPVFADGAPLGAVCADDAAKNGLTVVDLSDDWTPKVFARDPVTGDASPYRAKYVSLANLKSADLGLFGIASSLSVLGERLADEKRQACQAAIDRAPLVALQAELATLDDRAQAALVKKSENRAAVSAAHAQLVCDRFLTPGRATGLWSQSAQIGLDAFRRRHMIVSTAGLDAPSVGALMLSGEELDFRAMLRALRERVADAAGLIEDGSASGSTVPVVGRQLDFTPFAALGGDPPAPDAAHDLIGPATDAAARALGWMTPEAARAFGASHGGLHDLRVAVRLPPPPSYHSASMDLRVEIDRGDVFYDTPFRAAQARKKLGSVRPPSFVVYAKDGGVDRPVVRWATTIGGWQKERIEEGEVVLKYKESDVGERFWRHLVAAPAWMPPDSTPETDLLREGDDGNLALKADLIQPGFRNAYGLVMLIHEETVPKDDGTAWDDHGIRTHGSVNYKSIVRGQSHGCHRLYNHLALRLGGWLLAHRTYVRRGKLHSTFHRTLESKGQKIELDVPIRGYLYELDPPVPVRVLEGRIVGDAQDPITSLIRLKTDPDTSG